MRQFFQDSKGNFSSMRLVFVLMIANAIAMGWYTIVTENSTPAIVVVTSLAGVASGFKLSQNVQENAKDKSN